MTMNNGRDGSTVLAAIEAGGTKFICGVGTATGSLATARFGTRDPASTLADIAAFFAEAATVHGPVAAAGIASFGPLDLDPASPRYGSITTTPKPGWQGFDLRGAIAAMLGVPTRIDTDVNAAANAEALAQGAVAGLAYVTVGTGIGVGTTGGAPRAGHAEAGHLILRRHPAHDGFAGICPYHGDCLEGLASGPAIIAAWGSSLDTLPAGHPAWAVEADYIGQLCAAVVLMHGVARIVLGGGVMTEPALLDAIRSRTGALLGGYVERLATPAAFDALIGTPACREPSGLVGAYLLAAGAPTRMSSGSA